MGAMGDYTEVLNLDPRSADARGSRDDQNGSTAARCSESYMFLFFIRLQLGNLHQCVFDLAYCAKKLPLTSHMRCADCGKLADGSLHADGA